MRKINLISDTVTKPTPGMLQAMMQADVGDDVFGNDPSANRLEEKVAKLFGMEASLFCPSGTMTNQIAIKIHTNPLDEMICDRSSHVYQYEAGGYAFHSGIAVNLIDGTQGKITANQIRDAVKPIHDWLPRSKLVVIENSCNKGGGSYYTLDELKPISELCRQRGLKLHLDGARLFNVLVETGESTKDVGKLFDSISICISKGLGAPAGSLLIGNRDSIREARRFRKVMGGGMRQVGYLTAACEYALDNHVDRLKEDNQKAKKIAEVLNTLEYIDKVEPVRTNIVIYSLNSKIKVPDYLTHLSAKGIVASQFGTHEVRLVTHLDISDDMMREVIEVLSDGYHI